MRKARAKSSLFVKCNNLITEANLAVAELM